MLETYKVTLDGYKTENTYIKTGEAIYGPLTPILQGKMRRKKPTVHSKIVK